MDIPIYQVDALTARPFGGNPAAVCPLERWLDDATMQAIAAENNLSETAFFVPRGDDFEMYSACLERVVLPAIMDISARASSVGKAAARSCTRSQGSQKSPSTDLSVAWSMAYLC